MTPSWTNSSEPWFSERLNEGIIGRVKIDSVTFQSYEVMHDLAEALRRKTDTLEPCDLLAFRDSKTVKIILLLLFHKKYIYI